MSATIRPQFFETLDRRNANLATPTLVRLEERDRSHEVLRARRPCRLWKPAPKRTTRARKKLLGDKMPAFARTLAEAVIDEHEEASLSLAVCNTVSVAQHVYAAVRDLYTGPSSVVLLTSRFRAREREENQARLLAFEAERKRAKADGSVPTSGLLCVSTQVIEAGVDVSARRLWSEIPDIHMRDSVSSSTPRQARRRGSGLACSAILGG